MTTMKKSMIKTVFSLCIALSIFIYNPVFAFAAVCNNAPDGVHHFERHRRESGEFRREGETHTYLYGYDVRNNPIYRSDCKIFYYDQYCNFVCEYCGTTQGGTRHTHTNQVVHSVDHN